MNAGAASPGSRLREILPLYGVVFVGFLAAAPRDGAAPVATFDADFRGLAGIVVVPAERLRP